MHDTPWERLLTTLEDQVPPQVVDTWVRPGRLLTCRDNHMDIGVPSQFIRSYVLEHYFPQLQVAAKICLGPRAQVTVSVDRTRAAPSASPPPPLGLAAPPSVRDSRYTFNTFVIGSPTSSPRPPAWPSPSTPRPRTTPCSSMAGWASGRPISFTPSAHRLTRTHPQIRVQYLSTEKFTNELIGAIRYDKTQDFRQRYRTIDLLLIDDVQFLSGKERTQEEFFHTFNDLHESRRQIVLSSDRFPKEIPEIAERLRSRFEWGLIADIQPPRFRDPRGDPEEEGRTRSLAAAR